MQMTRVVTRDLPPRSRWFAQAVMSLMAEITYDDAEVPEGSLPRRYFGKHKFIAEQMWGTNPTKKQMNQVSDAVSLLREHGLLREVRAAANHRNAEYELIFEPVQIEIEKKVYAAQKAATEARYRVSAAKAKAVAAEKKLREAVGDVVVAEAEATVAEVAHVIEIETSTPLRGVPQHPLEGGDQHPLEGGAQHPLEGGAYIGKRQERDRRRTGRGTSSEVSTSPAPVDTTADNDSTDPLSGYDLAKKLRDALDKEPAP